MTFIVRARPLAGPWGGAVVKVDAHDGYAYGGGRDGSTGRVSAEEHGSFQQAVQAAARLLACLRVAGAAPPHAEVVEVLDRVVGQVDLKEQVLDARAPDAEDREPTVPKRRARVKRD